MPDPDGTNPVFCSSPPRRKGDPLVRYMIFHWALGMLGGALCVTLLLLFDPFGLRALMHDSGLGVPAVFLLYVGFMTSFGGFVCAAAIMFPPKDDDDDEPRGGLRSDAAPSNRRPLLSPVRAPARPILRWGNCGITRPSARFRYLHMAA